MLLGHCLFIHWRSVASVFAAAGAGLVDANAGQFRQDRLELFPEPLGDDFAGGIFQAGNVIEVVVIQLLIERLEDLLDLGEVTDPAGVGIDLAFDVDGDAEGVAVQPSAFVPGGDVGEAMGGLENKLFEQFHYNMSL